MPILKNAKKALRVSKRKTVINSRTKSRMKTLVDAFKKSPTLEALSSAYSSVDIAVKNNIIKKNKASRVKSQLSKVLPSGKTVASTAPKAAAKPAVKKTVAKPTVAKKNKDNQKSS